MTEDRQVWGSKLQFLLTCIGFAVGLGNLWKFPGTAYKYGGGAFLLPYIICSFCIGLPCLYLELFIGQFLRTGATNAFRRYKPVFQGIGWASTVMSAMVGLFYNMVVAICILYLKDAIIGQEQTWSRCDNTWNSKACALMNHSNFDPNANVLSTDEFYKYKIYGVPQSPSSVWDFGSLNLELLAALGAMWFLTCVCLIRGISWIGKISYITATVPYIIIGCLFINSCFLPGGFNGMWQFIKPEFSKLADPETWSAAANQLCLSLSLGYGGILALASFNPSDHNCFRDAAIIVFADGFMSVFGGCVVYATLGYISFETHIPIPDISKNGQNGLAFSIYPIALNAMPYGRIWAGALFFMFFLLGISSQFGLSQNVVTAITDQFPSLAKKSWMVVIAVCGTSFLIAFGTCWQNGKIFQDLLANYTGNSTIFLVIFLEILVSIHFYGLRNFMHDLRKSLGGGKTKLSLWFSHTGYIFALMWFIVSPLVLSSLTFLSAKKSLLPSPFPVNIGEYLAGLWIEFSPALLIPLFFILNFVLFSRSQLGWREAFRIQPEHPSFIRLRGSNKVYPQDEQTKV